MREGPLRLDEIETTLRTHQELLDGYVEWDDRRWGYNPEEPHAMRMEKLKAGIRRRFMELDVTWALPFKAPAGQ